MIVNLEAFLTITIDERKSNHSDQSLTFLMSKKMSSPVTLLGVETDDEFPSVNKYTTVISCILPSH